MPIFHLDEKNFLNAINKNDKTVIIDFYADWCSPCKMLVPVLEEVAEKNVHRADIYKVNVDKNEKLSRRFNIVSVPTIIIFKKGRVEKQFSGIKSKDELEAMI